MTKERSILTKGTRLVVMAVTVLLSLGLVNFAIVGKENVLDNGRVVLLRLAPRDPRSLLQGDYMALNYAMARTVAAEAESLQITDGHVVLDLAQNGEASFAGIYGDQELQPGQQLLRFRKRGESVRLGADAYFFEEGTWETYSGARFGELLVSPDGDAVLTGLRDGDAVRLGVTLLP